MSCLSRGAAGHRGGTGSDSDLLSSIYSTGDRYVAGSCCSIELTTLMEPSVVMVTGLADGCQCHHEEDRESAEHSSRRYSI